MPEAIVRLHVEKLPEGVFLATSEDLPGLVAQGRTLAETMEIAQDVARRLIESLQEHGDPLPPALKEFDKSLELTLQIAAPGWEKSEKLIFRRYYKKIGSDTHHWHRDCSFVPDDVERNPQWTISFTRPRSGEMCNTCKAKDRIPERPLDG